MEANSGVRGNLANLPDRLHHPGLVVRHHHADEPGTGPQGSANVLGSNHSLAIDRQEIHGNATLAQPFHSMQHGMVLNAAGNHMIAGLDQPKDRKIIALRTAAGENHLRLPAAQKIGHTGPRLLDRPPCMLPFLVNRGRIPERLQQKRPHRLKHFRQKRRSSIRIQVNSPHTSFYGNWKTTP